MLLLEKIPIELAEKETKMIKDKDVIAGADVYSPRERQRRENTLDLPEEKDRFDISGFRAEDDQSETRTDQSKGG